MNASERNNGVLVALQRILDILELMTKHLSSEQSNRKETTDAAEYDFWSEMKKQMRCIIQLKVSRVNRRIYQNISL